MPMCVNTGEAVERASLARPMVNQGTFDAHLVSISALFRGICLLKLKSAER